MKMPANGEKMRVYTKRQHFHIPHTEHMTDFSPPPLQDMPDRVYTHSIYLEKNKLGGAKIVQKTSLCISSTVI